MDTQDTATHGAAAHTQGAGMFAARMTGKGIEKSLTVRVARSKGSSGGGSGRGRWEGVDAGAVQARWGRGPARCGERGERSPRTRGTENALPKETGGATHKRHEMKEKNRESGTFDELSGVNISFGTDAARHCVIAEN